MSNKWLTIIQGGSFIIMAALYFYAASGKKNCKKIKMAEILLLYANTFVFAFSKMLSSAVFFIFIAAVVLFNIDKVKRNERRNKGYFR